ncbi:dentin sialophosphoprotein-like [Saccostrea echinata]|uniref:dentin sialophosphoprotein-like n=1 Tax=Saccostrea echinata TaxID=191078 RepID=UPI002A83F33B|nr:dentin sialophosphoprotein-like [Saccostrea echinata]
MLEGVVIILILGGCLDMVEGQQNCPEQTDPAVIIVATIFATLAVVFIVAGVICFLIWRRRRDLKSDKEKSANFRDENDLGVSNPAYMDGEGDLSLAEQGVGGYIQCREFSTPTQNQSSAKKKSWSPNSKSDLPPGKQGTHGSLDDLCMDPEISSVWLQSQDFVGLGFNIAGSMRDGIFVSQVHSRGPAVESGKFHVGDRILSVTVSFENMVYEDALTILSYASPYPVKITLQKERPSKSKERRSGHQRTILSHPLYRSQSMDTLLKINKEPVYTPKRSMSEMRQPKEVLDNLKQTLKVSVDSDNRQSNISEHSPEIHVSAEVEEASITQDKQPMTVLLPPPTGDDEDDDIPPPQPTIPPPPLEFNDMLDGEISTPDPTSTGMQFSSAFENLNEQDKLDMIRLSYEDPDTKINKDDLDTSLTDSREPALADVSFQSDSTVTEGEPKSPTTPVKPERKKKKSSSETSSLSSLDEAGDGQRSPRDLMPDIVEDHISMSVSRTENAAPSVEPSEVFEDVITPQKSDREIKLSSGKIELSSLNVAVTNEGDLPDSPPETSRTLVDYSLSDMESTLRPHTPENQPSIDEDIITPVQLKRGELESSMLNYFNDSGNTSTSTVENQQSLKTDSPNTTVTSVDFNINMNSNTDLFSTPYPKRNTKEGHSGMSYDISMMELNDIEKKLKQKTKEHTKQGVAFEVRDDVLSGETVMSRLTEDEVSGHVSRTKSCEDNLAKKAMLDSSLSWSGKRLVRAGSFSELPQDDSSDWVDHISLNNDESIISQEEDKDTFNSSEESLNSNNKNGLKKAKMFGARENLANLSSENSGSQQSISDSVSGGSKTPPPYLSNNGAHNGGTSSQDSTPVKPHINPSTSNIDSFVKVGENGPYSLSGDITPGDEEDC